MRFIEVGSLRQFRTDGDLQEEIAQIERLIESFRTSVLLDFISSI